MEMGVPGLKAAQVGVDAEVKALQNGIASIYPNINGTPEVKAEASRFIKAFINIDIAPECCVPVTGSMQGTFASFLTSGQCTEGKDTILFIAPGFPVQKQQIVVMGSNTNHSMYTNTVEKNCAQSWKNIFPKVISQL